MNNREKLKVYSPFNQKFLREIPMANADEVESVLKKAHTLFTDQQQWLPAFTKIEV